MQNTSQAPFFKPHVEYSKDVLQKKKCRGVGGIKKRKKGELTLINIRSSKNESESEANFMRQLIIRLGNYTGEFTNDFFKGPE